MALASDPASIEHRLFKAGRTVPPRSCAVVLPGGEAYLFGGQTAAWLTNSAERIDGSGSSRPLAPMPSPLAGHSCTALPDGRILVAGGAVHGFVTAALEIYDPAEDRWRSQGTLAVPRARHAATARGEPVRVHPARAVSPFHPFQGPFRFSRVPAQPRDAE